MLITNPIKIRGILLLTGSVNPAGGDFVKSVEQSFRMNVVYAFSLSMKRLALIFAALLVLPLCVFATSAIVGNDGSCPGVVTASLLNIDGNDRWTSMGSDQSVDAGGIGVFTVTDNPFLIGHPCYVMMGVACYDSHGMVISSTASGSIAGVIGGNFMWSGTLTNCGCTPPSPPQFVPPTTDDNNDLPPPDCHNGIPTCCGMPTWSVSEPFISLWLHDEPLGYQPAVGPRVSFELAFKQRESAAGFNPNLFGVGKRWNCSWLSYVTRQGTSNTVYYAGGGRRSYSSTNIDYLTNTRLTGDTTNGFILSHPDGSQDIYGVIVTNSAGAFQMAFLSQRLNPQGQAMTLNYASYTPELHAGHPPAIGRGRGWPD